MKAKESKLDDYDLINSKAIRNYCRKIKYQFNTEELAVLVYRNKTMNIEEKIAKYQDLINNYPDMEVIERINCNHYGSVKTLIQNEIDRIKSLYDDFVKEEKNCIYAWDEYNRSTKSYSRTNDVINNLKSTYKEVYTEVRDYINEYDDTISFNITKKYLDKDGSICANYIVIDKNPKLVEINREYEDLPDIEGIFVNIPVPFKKGDVLVNKILPDLSEKHIFVLNSLTVWNKRMLENFFTRNLDTSDMSGNGYYLDDVTHQVILDHVLDYDAFEFYDGELEGENRILKLISSFLKGKIDNLELFIKSYETFKSDYERKMPNIFVDEDLKLAGFNDWDISKIKREHEKIYNMEYEEKMDYIRHNTIALKGIKEEDIKQIESDYYDDVFVLTIDGKLYKNGQRIDTKIEQIHMFDGLHLYKVTDSNRIRTIDKDKKWDDIDTYLNNKDCSYKKVLMSTMNIVALTKDENVRAIHQYPACVIPENYVGVEDIKIEDENGIDTPYVYKDSKWMKLYIN